MCASQRWTIAAFLALNPLLVSAQTSILPADTLTAFRWSCSGGGMERFSVQGQAFTDALRLVTPPGIVREWDCRIRHSLATPLRNGDWLVATFWIRGGSEEAAIKLNFERAVPDYRKSVNAGLVTTTQWRRIQIPFRVVEDYQPGGASLDFWVGYAPQTVEVGGIQVMNHGPGATAPVPTLGFTYPGRELDAPWRESARQRIEEHRKAPLTIRVVDVAGRPITDAVVRVRMRRHAFGFGTAVAASSLLGTTANDAVYRDRLKENFNEVVIENDLKQGQWEQNRTRALNALEWLRNENLPVRGHNMVWPGWQYLPANMRPLAADPDALRARLDRHVLDIGAATRGLVVDWDVVNEPIANRDIQQILGDYELVRWFQLARSVDPDAVLYVNEFDIETGGGRNLRKQQEYLDLIQALLDRNAPLGGIGIQGHFGTDLTHPQRVYEILDRFAAFQLPVKITEFDIDTTDEELQGDYTRDYLTIAFSHPAVKSVLIWGFWEGRHWRPEAALFRRNWDEKPNLRAWRDLIFREWWTKADGRTGENGEYGVRGFLGEYDIEVERGGHVHRQRLTLVRDMEPLRVELP